MVGKEVEEGCKPVNSSQESGSVCVQVSGVCAGTGGQVELVVQVRPQV